MPELRNTTTLNNKNETIRLTFAASSLNDNIEELLLQQTTDTKKEGENTTINNQVTELTSEIPINKRAKKRKLNLFRLKEEEAMLRTEAKLKKSIKIIRPEQQDTQLSIKPKKIYTTQSTQTLSTVNDYVSRSLEIPDTLDNARKVCSNTEDIVTQLYNARTLETLTKEEFTERDIKRKQFYDKKNIQRTSRLSQLKKQEYRFRIQQEKQKEVVKKEKESRYAKKYRCVVKDRDEETEITPEYVSLELSLFRKNCIDYIKQACSYYYKHRLKYEDIDYTDDCDDETILHVNECLPVNIMESDEPKLAKDKIYCTTLIVEHCEVDKYVVETTVKLCKNKEDLYYAAVKFGICGHTKNVDVVNTEAYTHMLKELDVFCKKCRLLNYKYYYRKRNNNHVVYIY